jgi:hypothetical protein
VPAEDAKAWRMLQLLTSKPALYVCNVDEGSAATGNALSAQVVERATRDQAKAVVISAKIESEIAMLPAEERAEFLESLGLDEPGLNRMIHDAYGLLGLQTYFTVGPKEARAWSTPGRRGDPHRLREGLHPRRDHRFSRLCGAEGRNGRARGRQDAARGQGLCRQRRRRDALPVQHLTRLV